jgi:oligoribonuclease
MMQYISVDLETTGLDREQDQILEIAAVVEGCPFFDPACPVEELPFFRATFKHDRITGNPVALAMNATLIGEIAVGDATHPDDIKASFMGFLMKFAETYKLPKPRVTGAGKNFASFDLQFLKRWAPDAAKLFHHRVIDPAMFFIEPVSNVRVSLTSR